MTDPEFHPAVYRAERAAFCLDDHTDPGAIERWIGQVRTIPDARLRAMRHPPEAVLGVETRELLTRAAYFAHYSMVYPNPIPVGPPPGDYARFLSADILRGVLPDPIGRGVGGSV